MKSPFRRCGIAVLASVFLFTFGIEAKAQVLDGPQIFQLPPLDPANFNEDGFPLTLDTGVLAGLSSNIGDVPLNDVAIMGFPNFEDAIIVPIPTGNGTATGRVWSLVHTSTTNTQALAVATPVDVSMDFNDPEECYDFATSVQILDLTGDGVNDLGFMGPCFIEKGFSETANIMGIQGSANDPFQQAGSLTFLGTQLGGALFDFDAGQLAVVSADFNGDGLPDLGFYNQDQNDESNSLTALLNNETLGLLPAENSPVDGPVVPPDADAVRGFVIATGDFDGNQTADIAVAYGNFSGADLNELLIYSGNGDGTFDQAPMAQANLSPSATTGVVPLGMTSGQFDSNDFADFAVSWRDGNSDDSFLAIVLCDGTTCNVTNIPWGTDFFSSIVVAADFDSNGSDDIALTLNQENLAMGRGTDNTTVQIHLNQGGSFSATPDQTMTLDDTGFNDTLIPQVVTDDLDACGGPDLAFMGVVAEENPPPGIQLGGISQGVVSAFEYQAAVAFNPNEAPTANAGPDNGLKVSGGIQLGGGLFPGNPPTCSDPTNDAMEISWVQLSGQPATLNDSTAANPIITSAGGTADAVFEVTCTDACGLSDSDTVTVDLGLIQGSGCASSLTGLASGNFNATWALIPLMTGIMAFWRKKKS